MPAATAPLPYGHAEAIEARLKCELQQLLALAEEADAANIPDGMHLPEELERREDRQTAIAAATVKVAARNAGLIAQAGRA